MGSYWWGVVGSYLHLLGMAAYLGGSLIMEFVVGPAQSAIPPAQAQVMGQKTADKFLVVVWSSLGLLLASGVVQAFYKGTQRMVLLGNGWFSSSYGWTQFLMIVLWMVLVINGLIMTFVLRPKLAGKMSAQVGAQQVQAKQQEMLKAARLITRITRIDLGIALFLPLAGAGLIRGAGLFTGTALYNLTALTGLL